MSGLKLTLEGTKPIIGIKGLGRTSENWWIEEDEVLDGNNTILLMRSVLLKYAREDVSDHDDSFQPPT